MEYGTLLLNKVVEANDPAAFTRFGIDASHFATAGEKEAYKFIVDYSEANHGQAPSYAVLTSECEGFTYIPQVADSYDFLTKQVKEHAAKLALMEYITGKFTQEFNSENNGNKILDDLISEAERIKINTNTSSKIGTDIKRDATSFLDEYRKRKDGESFKIWRSKFPSINEATGGYLSGNMYTWYGRPGRGKSVITAEEAIESAFQGANVLGWIMEMAKFEWMARAYSTISARSGIVTATIEGVDYEAGFENRALLMGKLTDDFEKGFEQFLATINEIVPGNIVIRAADDQDFYSRGLKQLEADIIQTKADVVLVDPIYLMDYEANTSKVAGGDVANTSKRIRRLAGLTKTVIHIVTQAEEVRDDTDEEGNRELRPPKRAEIKKTKAVLEDAANTFGIDTLDGQGLVEIGKGRNGGEGTQIELLYLPNYGIVREIATGVAVANQFNF